VVQAVVEVILRVVGGSCEVGSGAGGDGGGGDGDDWSRW